MENKEMNTNSSKKLIIALTTIIAVLLVVIIVLSCLLINKSCNADSRVSDQSSVGMHDDRESIAGSQNDASASEQGGSIDVGTPDDDRDSITIDTKYAALYYPKEWESNLRNEIIDGDVYSVEFYGQVEGRDECHLFDLIFNGTEGYTLGTLETENGESVTVNIVSYDFDFDDTWTDDETSVLYAMHEDVNFIIQKLAQYENFTIPS